MPRSRRHWMPLLPCALAVLILPARVGAEPQGDRYALLVGVHEYDKNELRDLPYAEDDMTALADVLRKAGYKRVVLMTQSEGARYARFLPMAANIRKTLKGMLEDMTADDSVLVAFAGHGVQYAGEDDNYFCPMDAKLADKTTLVSLSEVYKDLEKCPAGTRLLLADCCRNDPRSDDARAVDRVKLASVTRPQRALPPGGVAAFFSCSAGEKAYENAGIKHGVFFHFIVEGLQGKADKDADGQVDLDELVGYTKKQVRDFVKDAYGDDVHQTPELVGKTHGQVTLAGTGKGWVQLFNGKDLAGWKTHPRDTDTWEVRNGILTSTGGQGQLFTERGDYENFQYRVEARINAVGNSGMYFRSEFAPGWPRAHYEAQICTSQPDQKTGSLYGIVKIPEQLHQPGEWFTEEVTAVGDHIQIAVNGKKVVDTHDPTYRRGHLALQQNNPATVVEFRKVEVKELPAPERETGWVQLFNGKDLTGWKTHPDDSARWEVKNGYLTATGARGMLFTEHGDYENFQFRAEARINEAGNSGMYFRSEFAPSVPAWLKAHYEAQISLGPGDPQKTGSLYNIVPIKDPLHQPGEWFTQEVTAVGDHIQIAVNGKTVVDTHDGSYRRGHLALQQNGAATVVEFRKVEVKELSPSPEDDR